MSFAGLLAILGAGTQPQLSFPHRFLGQNSLFSSMETPSAPLPEHPSPDGHVPLPNKGLENEDLGKRACLGRAKVVMDKEGIIDVQFRPQLQVAHSDNMNNQTKKVPAFVKWWCCQTSCESSSASSP